MPNLDSLPGDQRAVLQLVLGRGRSYDEIARLLSVDPEAVRTRARAALDALGPATGVPEAERQTVCDYLLGQLPAADVPAARARISGSPGERAWAQALSAELAPLARGALPEIPAAAGAGPTDSAPAVAPVSAPPAAPRPATPPAATPSAPVTSTPPPASAPTPVAPVEVALGAAAAGAADEADASPKRRRRGRSSAKAEKPARPDKPKRPSRRERRAAKAVADDDGEGARSSRIGGLIVIFVTVLVIAAIVVLLTRHHHATPVANRGGVTATNPATTSTTSTASASSTTSGTTSASAKPIAQINLTATRSGSSAAAIAEVLQQGSERELAIVGQDVPANTAHDSYEVWLYNSPTDAVSLGFVNPGVTSSGKLSAAGPLPADAGSYHRLIVTTETTAKPKRPGPILLSGAISGL